MFDSEKIKIRYYSGDPMALRPLWDTIFADPKCFADYYFENVCAQNKIVVAEDVSGNGRIIGMVHLNPYDLSIYGECERSYYIVGVAVEEGYRRQGIMRAMLLYALEDMKNKGLSMAFLMPEKKEYYRGLGFYEVEKQLKLEFDMNDILSVKYVADEIKKCAQYVDLSTLENSDLEKLAEDINSFLGKDYDIYARRNCKYMKRMILEQQCQSGGVLLVYEAPRPDMTYDSNGYNDIKILGLLAYSNDKECLYVERLEVLCEDKMSGFKLICVALELAHMQELSRVSAVIHENLDTSELRALLQERLHFIKLSEKPGHGYMALALDGGIYENAFFDEIV